MEDRITGLFSDFNSGTMNRRQLLQALGFTTGAAFASGVAPAVFAAQTGSGAGKSFPVTTMNHLSYAVRDSAKTRDWYVDLFGMQVRWDDGRRSEVVFGTMPEPNGIYIVPLAQPTDQPGVRHLAFGAPMTFIREN
ncbi:MAG: VOC family protein [Acidobacteria bacterium]|nr:VOC family protein [Acidobacteriota bacterium]